MATLEQHKQIVANIASKVNKVPTFEQLQMFFAEAVYILEDCPDSKYAFEISNYAKAWCEQICTTSSSKKAIDSCWNLRWDILKWEAPYLLDSYMIYLEKDREPKERFYLPRRRILLKHGLTQALQSVEDDECDILTISLPPGTGKAQPLYSKVLTPNGFVQMGSINIGDTVISASGKESKVLGVYPQGIKPIYELTFDDGSKCRCSDGHLWTVQTRDDRRRGNKHRTVELKEMLKNIRVENGRRANYSVDYIKPIDFGKKEVLLHPYVIGALLGDGGFSGGNTRFSSNDQEVIDTINNFLPNGYVLKHISNYDYQVNGHEGNNKKAGSLVSIALKKYGLFGKRSHEKFIPKDYLCASKEQRLWLLRGLLDTDGTCNENNITYTTASKKLAENIIELVHSLGGYASLSERNSGYKKDGKYIQCKTSYSVCVQFFADSEKVFNLSRHREKYNPKRKNVKRFIENVEYIGEEECQCIYIDDESHLYITDDYIITHNTTFEKFFLTWVIGRHPETYNLFYSHSDGITRMFYDGIEEITTNPEYRFAEIFPNVRLKKTDAKAQQLTFNKYKPFPNLQTGTIDSNLAGKVRCNGYLLCDDLIGKMEQALNKVYLDKLWEVKYTGDAKQRKMTGCKEIHIATRWSIHDVIGRIMRLEENNPRAKFISVDCYDENGESQFDYDYGVGLSTQFLHQQEAYMEDISFKCLYRNHPIEREGLLYHADDLRRYASMPDREPDAIIGICDTKEKGKDFLFLPVFYQYGNDYYFPDCIYSNESDYGVQYDRMVNFIIEHNMQQCQYESNQGGERVAYEVSDRIKKRGCRCNITTKPTETNKETKIIVNADWVKKNVLFRMQDDYTPKSDYGKAISALLSYSVTGKNTNDDVPDTMAMFALYVTNKYKVAKAEAAHNPYRRY